MMMNPKHLNCNYQFPLIYLFLLHCVIFKEQTHTDVLTSALQQDVALLDDAYF
jgi:hypothetical protein